MRRRLRQLIAWAQTPKVQRATALLVVGAGASCIKYLFEDIHEKLAELEERGMMPIDDFATVGDVDKLDTRVRVLEGKPPRSAVIDVDALAERRPDVAPPPPAAQVATEVHIADEEAGGAA